MTHRLIPRTLLTCRHVADALPSVDDAAGLTSALAKLGRIVHAGVAQLFTTRVPEPESADTADTLHRQGGHGVSARPLHAAQRGGAAQHRSAAAFAGAAASLMLGEDSVIAPAPALNLVIAGPPMLQQLCLDAARGNVAVTLLLQALQETLFSVQPCRWTVAAPFPSHDLFLLRCALLAGVAARLLFPARGGGGKSGRGAGRAAPRLRDRRSGGALGMFALARKRGVERGVDVPMSMLRDDFGMKSVNFVGDDSMLDDEAGDYTHGGNGDDNGIFGLDGDDLSEAISRSLMDDEVVPAEMPVHMDDFMHLVFARYAAAPPSVAASSVHLAGIVTPAALVTEVVAAFEAAGLPSAALPLHAFAEACMAYGFHAASTMVPAGVTLPSNEGEQATATPIVLSAIQSGHALCCEQFVRVLGELQRASKRECKSAAIAGFARERFGCL